MNASCKVTCRARRVDLTAVDSSHEENQDSWLCDTQNRNCGFESHSHHEMLRWHETPSKKNPVLSIRIASLHINWLISQCRSVYYAVRNQYLNTIKVKLSMCMYHFVTHFNIHKHLTVQSRHTYSLAPNVVTLHYFYQRRHLTSTQVSQADQCSILYATR